MNKKDGTIFRTILIRFIDSLFTLIMAVIVIAAVMFFSYKSEKVIKLIRFWGRTLLKISGISLELKGLDNIESGKTYTFVSNHQSNFDIPVLLYGVPKNIRMVAKSELFKIPVFGNMLKKAGFISIDRSHPKKALKSLNEGVKKIKQGINFLLFPEGTRTDNGEILPFKSGAFDLAIKAKTPIIPVTISGSYDINPKNRFTIKPGKITVLFDMPVDVEKYKPKERNDVMDIVYAVIEKNLNKMTFEELHHRDQRGNT